MTKLKIRINQEIVKTKQGGASLYIVVFLTLMFGVIALGFLRIVLNDAKETSNSDLYNSAYDSAMAGIEDAKVALIKYHDCINQGASADSNANPGTCPRIIFEMEAGIANDSCDVVQMVLNRSQDNSDGVIIQETQTEAEQGSASYMEQAYTCVKITERTPDYRTTLTTNDTMRIIPLHSPELQNVSTVEIGWYSATNASSHSADYTNTTRYLTGGRFQENRNEPYAPPVITFELFQTDKVEGNSNCAVNRAQLITDKSPCFSVSELSVANTNFTGTDHSLLMLYPVDDTSEGITTISAEQVIKNSDKHKNEKFDVKCNQNNGEFYCKARIELPSTFNNHPRAVGSTFAKVSLPYSRPVTDISLSFCNDSACSSTTPLDGVQAAVDSTGRANDLYRRLESRIELVDLFYPYAEYGLYSRGTGDVDKNYYVTRNCWESRDGNGSPNNCANSDWL